MISDRAKSLKPSATLALAAKEKALRAQGLDIVGFAAGEPDFDTPNHIKKAAIDAIMDGFTKYTAASGIDEPEGRGYSQVQAGQGHRVQAG